MPPAISGLHHVTAIATDPQRNLDFYTRVLGLRLVKLTVNFDDPTTYHLYYGDRTGAPGTILTFFPWPTAPRGRRGYGQATIVSFAVPAGSLGFWSRRLFAYGASLEESQRFARRVLVFTDPDGLLLELVESETHSDSATWTAPEIPAQVAIQRFHGVTLQERDLQRTARFLEDVLGFEERERWSDRTRFRLGSGADAAYLYLVATPTSPSGVVAGGTVHHIAWRTPDDAGQLRWREHLAAAGFDPTPVRDRVYFHSIYFLEPGQVLFEIATDPPGFTLDEPQERLGASLRLPPWLERERGRIEHALPPLSLPAPAGGKRA